MTERSRKIARRRTSSALPVDKIAKPAPLNSMRGTFRVAQANRVLAETLPGVVRNRSAEKRAKDKPALSLDPVQEGHQAKAQRRPSALKRNIPEQPGLDAADLKNLKCRPADNTPKGGKGSGRKFVPWDPNCST